MLKAIIFDFDGTIANTLPICFDAFRHAAGALIESNLTNEDIAAKYFGPSEEGVFQQHFPERAEELIQKYYRYYEETQKKTFGVPDGLVELIRALLNKGVRVALVTAKGPVSCRISLEHYGIADLFETIEVGSPKKRSKDQGILKALNDMGVAPEEAAYVGDSSEDVISARKAKVAPWSAAWMETAKPERILAEKPDEIFYTVEEFKARLVKEFGPLD